jgi:hypothetical protein
LPSITIPASTTWTAPSNISGAPEVQAWGESGSSGTAITGSHSGGSAGSGAYAAEPALGGVTAGTVLTVTIGTGGTGTATTVTGGSVTVQANAGGNATANIAGAAGAAGSNPVATAGTAGTNGTAGSGKGGAGGPGSPGASGSGGAGGIGSPAGGTAGTAGAGGGAAGGAGGSPTSSGAAGVAPGGAPGGGGDNGSHPGGTPSRGQVIITWTEIIGGPAEDYAAGYGKGSGLKKATGTAQGYAAGLGTASGSKHTTGSAQDYAAGYGIINPPPSSASFGYAAGTGTATGVAHRKGTAKDYAAGYGLVSGAAFNPAVVNAWSGSFAQPSSFGPIPPALQSIVIQLNPTYSVGSGSGYPSAGNWLFALVGWNQDDGLPPATFAVSDDIHSWWRPQSPSASSGLTRSVIWYTANLARIPAVAYVAPNSAVAGAAVLIVEVGQLGPWDTVTGYETDYAGGATSLGLALPAPT